MAAPEDNDAQLLAALVARARAEAAAARSEATKNGALNERDQTLAALELAEQALTEAERLRGEAESAQRRASFLGRVTRRMATSMDYESTLREVVTSAIPYVADWSLVSLVKPAGGVRVIGFGHHDTAREDLVATFATRYTPGPSSSITTAIRTSLPQMINEVTDAQLRGLVPDEAMFELVQSLGLRHFGTWPIPGPDGTPQGALSLIRGPAGAAFTEDERLLGETVATRAGLHISNARLHSERSEIAAALQESLLAQALPDVPGVDIAAAFLPAGEHNLVGGDFYDALTDAGDQVTVMLGDVAGKGPRAAAVTALARHTLRTAALLDPDPVRNLELLNRVLLDRDSGGRFCSVVLARLRPQAAEVHVRVACAGHPTPLIRRRDGSIDAVETGRGPLLGIIDGASFEAAEIVLTEGDRLVLYTDGLTEIRGRDPQFGERDLRAHLRDAGQISAHALVDRVSERALALQGTRPRDDIAVLAIGV